MTIFLLLLTAAITHLVISGGQTLLHQWMGHRRAGGFLFRSHINFHHVHYRRGRLMTLVPPGDESGITVFFAAPVALAGAAGFFSLPLPMFATAVLTAILSFTAHVWFDNSYHLEGAWLERFAWFRRKRQLHFVHHLHARANFAVIDFFWDRLFGTFREPGR